MHSIRNILVPVDFSSASERALDLALEFAERFAASLTVAHFYELPMYGPEGSFMITETFDQELRHHAERELERCLQARTTPVPMHRVVRTANAWEGINALAEELDVGLVVLGTHGRRGFKRALLGSVTEKVVRTCSRPVLTVRDLSGVAHTP